LSGVVLVERGKDALTSVFNADRLLEEGAAHPSQILGELGWIGGEVERRAWVRDGSIQNVPLWRWKILLR
jgi:hypothetical protein